MGLVWAHVFGMPNWSVVRLTVTLVERVDD